MVPSTMYPDLDPVCRHGLGCLQLAHPVPCALQRRHGSVATCWHGLGAGPCIIAVRRNMEERRRIGNGPREELQFRNPSEGAGAATMIGGDRKRHVTDIDSTEGDDVVHAKGVRACGGLDEGLAALKQCPAGAVEGESIEVVIVCIRLGGPIMKPDARPRPPPTAAPRSAAPP